MNSDGFVPPLGTAFHLSRAVEVTRRAVVSYRTIRRCRISRCSSAIHSDDTGSGHPSPLSTTNRD